MNMYVVMVVVWVISLVAVYVLKDQIKTAVINLWDRLINKIKGQ